MLLDNLLSLRDQSADWSWQSPNNSGRFVRAFVRFSDISEYPGDCHVASLLAMTAFIWCAKQQFIALPRQADKRFHRCSRSSRGKKQAADFSGLQRLCYESGKDGLQRFGKGILLSLGFGKILAQGGKVGLDLGLGAGGTDDDRGAAVQGVDQHVGRGQAGFGGV